MPSRSVKSIAETRSNGTVATLSRSSHPCGVGSTTTLRSSSVEPATYDVPAGLEPLEQRRQGPRVETQPLAELTDGQRLSEPHRASM